MKTFTPDLDPAVLERLREYATRFAPDFPALAGKVLTPGPTLVELTQKYYAQPEPPATQPAEKAP